MLLLPSTGWVLGAALQVGAAALVEVVASQHWVAAAPLGVVVYPRGLAVRLVVPTRPPFVGFSARLR